MKENATPQTVVETVAYLKAVNSMWDEDTKTEFINHIALHPDEGDIIPGTGGIRKIRWQASGRGKRGGARVIYYVYDQNNPIYLLFAYPKNVQDNISEKEKKVLASVAAAIKAGMKQRRSESL